MSVGDRSSGNEKENSDISKLMAEQCMTQEKIANEMLRSVRAIKEKSQIASQIVKNDIKVR